jgi:hypothetical protein
MDLCILRNVGTEAAKGVELGEGDPMKTLKVFVCAMLLVWGISGSASATPYLLPSVSSSVGGGWFDVNQGPTNYCWLASASNMLAYSQWNGGFANADAIFTEATGHWSNVDGNPYYAIDWWFDGTNLKQGVAGWPQVTTPGGGYYLTSDPGLGFAENTNGLALANIQTYLSGDVSGQRAFSILLGNTGGGIHWLTGWGYEGDGTTNGITGVYFTDSFDGVTNNWQSSPLNCASGDCYLNVYTDYYIISMVAMDYNSLGTPPGYTNPPGGTVPDPASTLLLFGMGLSGLFFTRRSLKK